jgi:integrase
MAMKLTAKRVETLKKQPGRRYSDGHGLKLQVVSLTNSSWLFCYERQGRRHEMGLGPTHTISLKAARERAHAARVLLLDGVDPLAQKRAARDAAALEAAKNITFATLTSQYIASHEAKWRDPRHSRKFLAGMRAYVYPTIGNMPVALIDETLVLKCLTPIWRTKTETASRLRSRIEAILDYATAAKLRKGDNPARWAGNLAYLLPAPDKIAPHVHHAALPYAEVGAFIERLRAMPSTTARALEFLILTAARTGEAVGAHWTEIDWQAQTWTIPAARMKGGQQHRVPLSPRALELLSALHEEAGNPYVFIGARAGTHISLDAMYSVTKKAHPAITNHGFRSAFSTWAHETTAFADHVIEQALAHTVGSKVKRAYHRGDLFDKRRALMVAWDKYCSTTAPVPGTVIPLRGVS